MSESNLDNNKTKFDDLVKRVFAEYINGLGIENLIIVDKVPSNSANQDKQKVYLFKMSDYSSFAVFSDGVLRINPENIDKNQVQCFGESEKCKTVEEAIRIILKLVNNSEYSEVPLPDLEQYGSQDSNIEHLADTLVVYAKDGNDPFQVSEILAAWDKLQAD